MKYLECQYCDSLCERDDRIVKATCLRCKNKDKKERAKLARIKRLKEEAQYKIFYEESMRRIYGKPTEVTLKVMESKPKIEKYDDINPGKNYEEYRKESKEKSKEAKKALMDRLRAEKEARDKERGMTIRESLGLENHSLLRLSPNHQIEN